ncbi:unnamed protein product [Ambrosiozyma monospora]|uniref:Unnamed protein product n=1 Tax=Ambrosiozyma monospora TaxID=43982 RepID=A0ACB5T2X4_AMBMO|nr:unnamed protein product [Ambrosiozyma monospora]
MYAENLYQLKERRKTPINLRDGGEQKSEISSDDYYRDIRSRVVLVWVLCNVILVMTITQIWKADAIHSNTYLAFILWCVFGFAIVRFGGSLAFLLHLCVRRIVVTFHKWQLRRSGDEGVDSFVTIPN